MYKKIIHSVFFCTFLTISCASSKVAPEGKYCKTQTKNKMRQLWAALNCCKKPHIIEKERTGWGWPKQLTHNGSSLPKGWRRASSHDDSDD